MPLHLKGRAEDIAGTNARIQVWYVEDDVRTSYTGTLTACEPNGRGLRVWFDGMRKDEQEWVGEEDEWEWAVDEPPATDAEAALPISAVRLHVGGFGLGDPRVERWCRGRTSHACLRSRGARELEADRHALGADACVNIVLLDAPARCLGLGNLGPPHDNAAPSLFS